LTASGEAHDPHEPGRAELSPGPPGGPGPGEAENHFRCCRTLCWLQADRDGALDHRPSKSPGRPVGRNWTHPRLGGPRQSNAVWGWYPRPKLGDHPERRCCYYERALTLPPTSPRTGRNEAVEPGTTWGPVVPRAWGTTKRPARPVRAGVCVLGPAAFLADPVMQAPAPPSTSATPTRRWAYHARRPGTPGKRRTEILDRRRPTPQAADVGPQAQRGRSALEVREGEASADLEVCRRRCI